MTKDIKETKTLQHKHGAGRYVGEFVYGANDGIITTFAVVAGAAGASLSPEVVIILGFANILADGISMGASSYLGAKSEQEYAKAERKKEYKEIEHLHELEVEALRKLYTKKGFTGKDLDRVVEVITSDKDTWVETIMREERDIIQEHKDPKKNGFATFMAFVFAGLIPLLPYAFGVEAHAFLISSIIGLIAFFMIGALRSLVTSIGWIRGGLEMLLVGSTAALVAYFVGAFVEGIIK